MKAQAIVKPGVIEELSIPEPVCGSEDLLLKPEYVGLCGTDLSIYRGLFKDTSYPRVCGHEIGARVLSVGKEVQGDFAIGDTVTVLPYYNCGSCPACRQGRPNCCARNKTLGVQIDGALTELISTHYSKVYPVYNLSSKISVLIEPIAVGLHAVNRARVSNADTVLLFGCGAVGLGVALSTLERGARLIAVDIDDKKLERVEKLGDIVTLNIASEKIESALQQFTNSEGPSVVIEAVGSTENFGKAVELAAQAGRVAYIGWTKQAVSYEASLVIRKELDIVGCRNSLDEFPEATKICMKWEQVLSDFITAEYNIQHVNEAFEDWDSGKDSVIKYVIKND